jgi:hypothetical protein
MAAIEATFTDPNTLALAACWADGAIGPETRFKVLFGCLRIGKLLEELEGAYCASAHWGISYKEYALFGRGSQAYNSYRNLLTNKSYLW